MAYKMFNYNFNEVAIESFDWKYLYVTDYKDFVREFGKKWILNGIERDGIYEYEEFYEKIGGKWRELTDKNSFIYKTISEKVSSNVEGIKEEIIVRYFKKLKGNVLDAIGRAKTVEYANKLLNEGFEEIDRDTYLRYANMDLYISYRIE